MGMRAFVTRDKWQGIGPVGAAIAALLVGAAVYLLDRQPQTVYLLADWVGADRKMSGVFGGLGNSLPTFVHVYAFSLFTVAVLSVSRRGAAVCCFIWAVVDGLFELGQLDAVARVIAEHVPAWFGVTPLLENTANYFHAGTFDVFDLVSIALGAIAAYVTFQLINSRTRNHVPAI